MVSKARGQAPDLTFEQWLGLEAAGFTFFQLSYLLDQRLHGESLLGGVEAPAKERVLFQGFEGLSFPASEVQAVESGVADGDWVSVQLNLLGLVGSGSPLPSVYLEAFGDLEDDRRDGKLFLDFFYHRLLSLLYRAWRKYRFYLELPGTETNPFRERILSLQGLHREVRSTLVAEPGEHDPDTARVTVFWEAFVAYAGMLIGQRRSGESLGRFLNGYFGWRGVEVEECVRRRVRIGAGACTALGRRNGGLGVSALVGSRVKDRTGLMRIRIPQLDWETFFRFLPIGERFRELAVVLQALKLEDLDVEVELGLQAAEVPALRLGSGGSGYLGWSSWLPAGGRGDVCLRLGI